MGLNRSVGVFLLASTTETPVHRGRQAIFPWPKFHLRGTVAPEIGLQTRRPWQPAQDRNRLERLGAGLTNSPTPGADAHPFRHSHKMFQRLAPMSL